MPLSDISYLNADNFNISVDVIVNSLPTAEGMIIAQRTHFVKCPQPRRMFDLFKGRSIQMLKACNEPESFNVFAINLSMVCRRDRLRFGFFSHSTYC